MALLHDLTEGELRLFELLYVRGATVREVGRNLRISGAALALRKLRLRKKLRRIVKEIRDR